MKRIMRSFLFSGLIINKQQYLLWHSFRAMKCMRKLKLQMNITVDGFVGRENHEMDWVTFDWGDKVGSFCIQNLEEVDFILLTLGKKADATFITYWHDTAKKPEDPYYELAKKISSTPKIALTQYAINAEFPNTEIIQGNIIEEVKRLKSQAGNELLVYGGVRFASSLVENDLIDEFSLLVNPVAMGKGLPIFDKIGSKLDLQPTTSEKDTSGIIINTYLPGSQI
jgi:dihydrofolate reductase